LTGWSGEQEVRRDEPERSPDATRELARRRRIRNWALFVVLVALAVLFYAITIVKMKGHA
jgi:ferric-dicitrate binding protein FerR (iron transport regulator)